MRVDADLDSSSAVFVDAAALSAGDDGLHRIAEPIDLRRRGVNIGADSNPAYAGPRDRRNENVILAHQRIAEFSWLDRIEVNGAECAGLVGIQFDQHFGAGNFA